MQNFVGPALFFTFVSELRAYSGFINWSANVTFSFIPDCRQAGFSYFSASYLRVRSSKRASSKRKIEYFRRKEQNLNAL